MTLSTVAADVRARGADIDNSGANCDHSGGSVGLKMPARLPERYYLTICGRIDGCLGSSQCRNIPARLSPPATMAAIRVERVDVLIGVSNVDHIPRCRQMGDRSTGLSLPRSCTSLG